MNHVMNHVRPNHNTIPELEAIISTLILLDPTLELRTNDNITIQARDTYCLLRHRWFQKYEYHVNWTCIMPYKVVHFPFQFRWRSTIVPRELPHLWYHISQTQVHDTHYSLWPNRPHEFVPWATPLLILKVFSMWICYAL